MGIGYDLIRRSRFSIGLNGTLRAGNEINDWKKVEIIENPEPTMPIFNTSSSDRIDQAVITNPKSESNLMTSGEFGLPIKYQATEKIGVKIFPFIRKYLSQKYPGSDNFGESFQWGVGTGITF